MPGIPTGLSTPAAPPGPATLSLPGASGGIALNSAHRLAYVSGLANSRWQPSKHKLPGAEGNAVLGYSWTATCGQARLVTNEAAGTVSVVDLQRGVKLTDITVGPPLSHPQGVVVDAAGARAYVALSASDQVVVVDVKKRAVERTISVGRPARLGTMPVALALNPAGDRLFVAESGADEIAAIRLPARSTPPALSWTVVGRTPTTPTTRPRETRTFLPPIHLRLAH